MTLISGAYIRGHLSQREVPSEHCDKRGWSRYESLHSEHATEMSDSAAYVTRLIRETRQVDTAS
jgi:hypothetical protein